MVAPVTRRFRPNRARTGTASRYAGLVRMTLIPVSRGTRAGSRSRRDHGRRPGRVQTGGREDAEAVADGRRQQHRSAEQADAEVLRQVARVLEAPVGVVAERRVAVASSR